MRKLLILAAFGAGYVLGTKAGRQRYEQIKRFSRQVADNPKVQGVAGLLEAQAEGVVETVKAKVVGSPPAGGAAVPGAGSVPGPGPGAAV